jgi:hypothetical protein
VPNVRRGLLTALRSRLSPSDDESFNAFLGSAVSPHALSPDTQEGEHICATMILAEDLD